MAAAKKEAHLTFETWGDFLADTDRPLPMTHTNWQDWMDSSRQESEYRTKFNGGCASFSDAVRLAWQGWPEGREHLRPIRDALLHKIAPAIIVDDVAWGTEGLDYDIGRVMSGEPECWLQPAPRRRPDPRTVAIINNLSVSHDIDPAIMIARGAALVALIELLEFANVRCDVSIAMSSTRFSALARVKPAAQPLDVGRMIFALAHPACFRRLGFGLKEQRPDVLQLIGKNYGRPMPFTRAPAGAMVVQHGMSGDPHWQDTEAVRRWVRTQLAAQGVLFRDEEAAA